MLSNTVAQHKLAIVACNYLRNVWSIKLYWSIQLSNILLSHGRNTNSIGIFNELADYVTGKVMSNCVPLDQTCAIFSWNSHTFPSPLNQSVLSNHICRRGNIPGKMLSQPNCSCNILVLLKQFLCCSSKSQCCSSNTKKCVINKKIYWATVVCTQLCCTKKIASVRGP